jgi:hypothetical protein
MQVPALWPEDVLRRLAENPDLLDHQIAETQKALLPCGRLVASLKIELFRVHFGGSPLPTDKKLRVVAKAGRAMDDELVGEIPATLIDTAVTRLWARWKHQWQKPPGAGDFREAIAPEWTALKNRLGNYLRTREILATTGDKILQEARDRAAWIARRRAAMAAAEAAAAESPNNPQPQAGED